MGSLSIWHLLILLAVVLILFGGGGKLSKIMGDFGSGITAFKKGINKGKDEEVATTPTDRKQTETIERS
ncbi:MAG TPA: twin-arginine translocase TatA/TatE family subunit [Dongiaceae bacterium]|jgi:sec-independent protein translocase protein TatA